MISVLTPVIIGLRNRPRTNKIIQEILGKGINGKMYSFVNRLRVKTKRDHKRRIDNPSMKDH
jgi:hypothetical protein